jgi:cytochrome c oxidase subunit 1
MYKGSIWLATPMCYALSVIFLFGIGGLTGLFLGALATDVHLQDTYFVVAHFHYTMMGGVLMAFLGGLHYWWPKFTGKMFSDRAGQIACLVIFVGFNLTFFPQFVMGSQGMPRRYHDYLPEYELYHVLSSIGTYIMTAGLLLVLAYLLRSLFAGRPAPANPWGAGSLEWQCSSPPPHDNFASPPVAGDPYDYSNLTYDPSQRGYIRVAEAPP